MAGEIPALILDNGSGSIKAGFSGEDEPQLTIPSLVGQPRTKFLNIHFNPNLKDYYVGKEAQINRDILTLNHPIQRGVITNWDHMEKLWQYTFDKLDVYAKEQPILLTDIPNNQRRNREKMAEIMFETFRCPALYIAIQGTLSLHAHGLVTGVAVDCGADVTQIVPIIEGYVMADATSCLSLGGNDLTLYLMKLLTQNGVNISAKHYVEDVCKVKEKLCHVTPEFIKEMDLLAQSQLRKTYILPDNQRITIGNELFSCPEALFQPRVLGKNFNGIHKICCDSIIKSKQSDEITKDLFRNIVLSGGSSMFSGLPERFFEEVKQLTPPHVESNVLVVSNRQNNVWIGGSIVTSLSAFQEMWLTKKTYHEYGPSIIHKKCI